MLRKEEKVVRKLFVLYDGRARSGSVEDATVMDTAESVKEIREMQRDFPCLHPRDSVWYECDDDGKTLTNRKMRTDLDEK